MNTIVEVTDIRERFRALAILIVTVALAVSTFSLSGCGGASADEQDNCYGEDMPVINE